MGGSASTSAGGTDQVQRTAGGVAPVNRTLLRVAWYRFRGTLGRRWNGYLGPVVLIGAGGGLAMGAVAGAGPEG